MKKLTRDQLDIRFPIIGEFKQEDYSVIVRGYDSSLAISSYDGSATKNEEVFVRRYIVFLKFSDPAKTAGFIKAHNGKPNSEQADGSLPITEVLGEVMIGHENLSNALESVEKYGVVIDPDKVFKIMYDDMVHYGDAYMQPIVNKPLTTFEDRAKYAPDRFPIGPFGPLDKVRASSRR